MKIFNWITKWQIISALFIITALLLAGFILCSPLVGGTYLDTVSDADKVNTILSQMSGEEKKMHIIITIVLDMLFPFMYGGLFIALTIKYLGKISAWLSLPAILVIPLDLVENLIQICTLSGRIDLITSKSILTHAKVLLFKIAGIVALIALGFATVPKIIKKRT